MSLSLHLRAANVGLAARLYKVLDLAEALTQRYAPKDTLVDVRTGPDVALESIAAFGFAGVISQESLDDAPLPQLHSLSINEALAAGDAARVSTEGKINVLYRRGANANTLFVTERCNSLCLMCSQPPREVDDAWRVRELIDLLPLIDPDLDVLGVTGGEPTLLGLELLALLAAAKQLLPATRLHVLTNGRTFADGRFANLFDDLRGHVTWAVPLYADVAHVHDFVVQSSGAFAQTMHGLHNLGERGHRVEIRNVLHAQTLPRLTETARFIYRNLPFVEHVALMGLEPMGLARANMQLLATDPRETSAGIAPAVQFLHQAGMNVSIYNLPLCSLDPALWPFARKSISDWKNDYANACASCVRKEECCGFFRSTSTEWRNRVASPLREIAA
jgi:His-Xaa-Ser system radical SAM maturase HxsC